MSRQEQELDAAEYVIGTLSGVERRVFEDLMATDKQTQEDVWYWERAFGALNASISPNAPPVAMWERIDGSLPAKSGPRRLPNLLKPKKLKDKKQIEPKKPEVPPVENEPVVPDAPDLVEEKTVGEIEPKKSKIWLNQPSEASPEPAAKPNPVPPPKPVAKSVPQPIPEPEKDAVAEEIEKTEPVKKEPVKKVIAPVYEKARPVEAKKSPDEVVETPTHNLTRKLRRWRLIALVAIICLLGLLWWMFSQRNKETVVTNEPVSEEQKANQYLAVVNANGDQPSLVIQIDAANGAMKINPIGILTPTGKSLQLWYRPKTGERVSVGLIDGEVKDFPIAGVEEGGVLEISVEPAGGAQSNEPSGPVVYFGVLAEMQPK